MQHMDGYVPIPRSLLEEPAFSHQTALKIWIWCLMKATWKDRPVTLKVGKGVAVINLKSGQFVFGRNHAEKELSIDGSTIYKWIDKFKSEEWHLIKVDSNNQYSIITICDWDKYKTANWKEEQLSSN